MRGRSPMTGPAMSVAAKTALRRSLLSRRLSRPAAERAAGAAAVAAALLHGLAGVRTLAAHVPDATEPGFGVLPASYDRLDVPVLLPVVPADGAELDWALSSGELLPGRYGLLEPGGPRAGAAAIRTADAVVVPALAVDRWGVRLGRGGGYYDRALVHVRPDAVLVAVVFDDEQVDELPREPHDRPVSAVVTPSGGWQVLPARTG